MGCLCKIQVPPISVADFLPSDVTESFFHFHTQRWKFGGLVGLVMQCVDFEFVAGGKS